MRSVEAVYGTNNGGAAGGRGRPTLLPSSTAPAGVRAGGVPTPGASNAACPTLPQACGSANLQTEEAGRPARLWPARLAVHLFGLDVFFVLIQPGKHVFSPLVLVLALESRELCIGTGAVLLQTPLQEPPSRLVVRFLSPEVVTKSSSLDKPGNVRGQCLLRLCDARKRRQCKQESVRRAVHRHLTSTLRAESALRGEVDAEASRPWNARLPRDETAPLEHLHHLVHARSRDKEMPLYVRLGGCSAKALDVL